MSYNDTIYSGTSAHSARAIADELHHREWPHTDDNFRDLAGAVTTLARQVDALTHTVEQQAREIAERVRIGPLPPLREPAPAAQLESVYSGLAEIWRMARARVEPGGNPAEPDAETGALIAIEARCRAMLESAGRLPEANL
jgi:hypothetical protein